jgi:four helix bundle protein
MGQSFRDLIVWQRAIELTFAIYKLTAGFPETERYGLSDQVRRAAVSIASNISEGYGRSTSGEYALFLGHGHARGSVCEVQTQLVIAAGLGYGSDQTRAHAEKLAADVSRMLNALLISVKQRKLIRDVH